MRGVARQQHAFPTVRFALEGAIGPRRCQPQRVNVDVDVRHAPQHRLDVFSCDPLRPMSRSIVELANRDHAGLGVDVNACRSEVLTGLQRIGVGELDLDRIGGKLRVSSAEAEAAGLAHNAAATIASD